MNSTQSSLNSLLLLLLLSRFSRVRLCLTPLTAAYQASPSMDSPGKNTGVGCHFLLQCMKVESESEVAQSCLTLSDPMDCSLPGSSIHGIFRATVLEWRCHCLLPQKGEDESQNMYVLGSCLWNGRTALLFTLYDSQSVYRLYNTPVRHGSGLGQMERHFTFSDQKTQYHENVSSP